MLHTPFAVLEGASTVFYVDATDLNTDDFYNCYMIIVQGNLDIPMKERSFEN